MDGENPYASPREWEGDAQPITAPTKRGVVVSLLRGAWLYRRFAVSLNQIQRVVEYNGRAWVETVFVDGQLAFRQRNWGVSLVPTLPFEILAAEGAFRAMIHVRGVYRLAAIRMLIDDELVYSEGSWIALPDRPPALPTARRGR